MLDSSTDCSAFRLEWRPSRYGIAAALCLPSAIGLAAALSGLPAWSGALSQELPGLLTVLLPLAGIAIGLRQARRAAHRPSFGMLLLDGRRIVAEAGIMARPAVFTECWPLAVLRIEPQGPAWVFWPDTLSTPARRHCRLWAAAAPTAIAPHHWML